MIRIVLTICLLALCVPVGYFGSEAVTELSEMSDAREERKRRNRERVMRILKADDQYVFQQVVVGPGDDTGQSLDFRARVYLEGIGQAAYGTIRTECPMPAEAPGCWEMAALYVDGVSVYQAGRPGTAPDGEASAASTQSQVTSASTRANSIRANSTNTRPAVAPAPGTAEVPRVASNTDTSATETGTNLEVTALAAPDSAPANASANPAATAQATPTAQPVEAVPATHTVVPSLVNARAAPRGQPLTRLPRGTLLHLLERDGAWGHFRVLAGEDTGREVWVALSVVNTL